MNVERKELIEVTLTPEEKTALNIIANIDCTGIDCDYCPLKNEAFQPCVVDVANKVNPIEEE